MHQNLMMSHLNHTTIMQMILLNDIFQDNLVIKHALQYSDPLKSEIFRYFFVQMAKTAILFFRSKTGLVFKSGHISTWYSNVIQNSAHL